jgi:hypothetical protein
MRMKTRLENLIEHFPADRDKLEAIAATLRAEAAGKIVKLDQKSPDGDPAYDMLFSFDFKKTPQGQAFWQRRYDAVNTAKLPQLPRRPWE